ncbi:MAG TPA: type II CAAX endopeptidase family protein [Opitutus sp.]|nr:type II CAAX endopeptidase family protein [Opitutus sp.]
MPIVVTEQVVYTIELALLLLGVFLLWRHVWSPAARARLRFAPSALPPWSVSPSEFLFFTFVIVIGALIASAAAGVALRAFPLSTDAVTVVGSAAFQVGLLIGPCLLPLKLGHPALLPPLDRTTLRSGLATFLIALPVVTVTSLLWLGFLKLAGLPAEQQDLLRMFAQADSKTLLAVMIVLATLIAPITEELLFRATIFRYLRTRIPRWLALVLPGLLFASLHVNWSTLDGLASFAPLTALAVVFSLGYERTGRIGTAMVAHAIFNLHTILVLFAGLTPP